MIFRVLSFNIHKGYGWNVSQSTLHSIHENISLLQSDIVFLQEVRGSQVNLLSSTSWNHTSYGKNVVYAKGHHGNAILSKFPIIHWDNIDLSMHRFEKRGLLHSMIQVTETEHVDLLCIHLGLFRSDRKKQIKKIVDYIESTISSENNLILGGDFNDWGSDATKPLIEGLGLKECFLEHHGAYARTYPAWTPFFRLDRMYYRGLKSLSAHRLLKKSWRNLSDHIAIEVEFTL